MDEKYKYSYKNDSDYCYSNTNILKSKLNIKSDEDLYDAERDIVNIRVVELYEKLLLMFKKIVKPISKEEQIASINSYFSKTLRKEMIKLIDQS